MNEPHRGAIVGFGNVAAHGHTVGWLERPDFRILAVVDPDPARRSLACERLPEARVYDSLERLFATETLDFIDVCAPPALHRAAIEAAAQARVHVLCEKPLTTSLQELHALQDRVRDAGIVLHTVHNWKYSEAFRAVLSLVREGAIGSVRTVSFDTARNGCSVTTGENWRMNKSVAGGGILVDHGWHTFYLLLALAGERPLRIRAELGRQRYSEAEVEDTVHCVVDFPSLTGEIRLTWAAEGRHTSWKIGGSDGELAVDEDLLSVTGRAGARTQRLSSGLSVGSHHPDWFSGVIDEFQTALASPAQGRDNLAEAALCVQMLHLAYASDRQNEAMEIPPP